MFNQSARTSPRRFTTCDATVLVTVTLPAMLYLYRNETWPDLGQTRCVTQVIQQYFCVFYLFAHVLAPLSFACLALRLRGPRPSLRRLLRQPGMVACTAAAIVLSLAAINVLCVAGALAFDFRSAFWIQLVGQMEEIAEGTNDDIRLIPSEVGCAVAVAWTMQALGGRWRPEQSWIDRFGRMLGILWIANFPFVWFRESLCGVCSSTTGPG